MRRPKYPLPTSVKVGPHPYKVAASDDVAHATGEDEGLFGHVDHRACVITIGSDMSLSQSQDTVLHEALHAVLLYLGKDDEDLVALITPPLLDLLQRNPRMVEYLVQKRVLSW